MPKLITRIMQAFGVYRVLDVIYSIWSGKSLLGLAAVSAVSVVIANLQEGFDWGVFDLYVLTFALIYAALAFGWWATISVHRKISPKDRFVVTNYGFACIPDPFTTPHSNPKAANSFQAIINMQNIAEFPISYRLDDIEFKIGNTVAGNKYTNLGTIIDAWQPSQFNSDHVVFHKPIDLPVSGTLLAKIKYGKPGKEKFEKAIALAVTFSADANAPYGVRHTWNPL